ncbi:MAG: hypothetical protein QG671_4270, partial [Actinomycetota bacterium]|nr:hypothetical protein [Actinomycetota bacterium]
EADLGVDTVKQAEVFATVREKFDIARDDELQLRDFPTLQHVIDWMSSRVSVGNALTGELQPPVGGAGVGPRIPTSTQQVPRRVPVPVLRPELSECEPTGVSLGAGDHIVIGTDQSGVADELAATLRDRGCDVTLFAPEPESVLPVEPVTGIFWLPALDEDGDLPDLESWRSALGRRLHSLYALVRHTVDQAPFLVTGTRLGGLHGYGQEPASNALGGGVTGFAKSYHREQPLTTVKAIDFGPAAADTVAAALCEEALRGPGQVEIGRYSDQRFGIGLAEQPLTEELHTSLHPDSVFVVTGASGAIAAAVAADLAEVAGGGTFYLLARTELPDAGDPDVATLRSDPAGLRDVVIERLTETGARVTPVEVAAVVAAVERGANARAGVDAVVAAGGVAIYRRTDVADPVAVEEVISEIRAAHQRVDVLIHAAGIEVSKDLTRKDEQEFANVVSVKADGWFNLLAATTELEVGVAIAFTSIAGRFGNAGQTDYAAGNDLICKSVSELRGTRPGTRAVALDWTAWGGIGMATRGSIPQVMAAAGVELLDPGCGIDFLRREILHGTQGGEVVVAGELGLMAAGSDPTGGLRPQPADGRFGPMIDTLDQLDPDLGLVATVTLDPREQPFLTDHRIDGTAVLPGVMGIEAMIAAAMAMAPGWHPVAIEEVDFRAPVKFYRDEPRTLTVTAAGAPLGDDLVFSCVLSASRVLPGRAEPQSVDHFTGRVRLSRSRLPDVEFGELLAADQIVSAEDVYRFYFHGPAYQVVNSAWRTSTGVAAQMAADLPRHHDGDNGTVTRPRLIELCFQTAGLVEAGRDGRLALPSHVDRVEFITSNSVAESECRCEVLEGADGFDVTVVDAAGTTVVRVLGYRTIGVSDDLDPLVRGPLQEVLVGGLA